MRNGGHPSAEDALARAADAGQWAVVAPVARELEARRLARAGVTAAADVGR
jgi:hypothetical protein